MTPVKESTAYQPPKTLWNASYLLILAVSTLSSFSFYMTATIMSKYLVSLGATIAFAGVVVGLFSITSLVCRPFCGLMADRLNNIWLLIVSNILMGIGMARVWLTKSPVRKGALTVFLVQLAMNFLWTVWFFGLQKYLLAFLWLVALVFAVAEMCRRFSLAEKLAGRLQLPYVVWTIFAAALNLAVWLLNK